MAGARESPFSKLLSSTYTKAIQTALQTNDTTCKIFAQYRAGLNDLTCIMLRYHEAVNNGEPAWETVGVPSDIQVQHETAMQHFKAVAELPWVLLQPQHGARVLRPWLHRVLR